MLWILVVALFSPDARCADGGCGEPRIFEGTLGERGASADERACRAAARADAQQAAGDWHVGHLMGACWSSCAEDCSPDFVSGDHDPVDPSVTAVQVQGEHGRQTMCDC